MKLEFLDIMINLATGLSLGDINLIYQTAGEPKKPLSSAEKNTAQESTGESADKDDLKQAQPAQCVQ